MEKNRQIKTGTVKMVKENGYGFIKDESLMDIFFIYSGVRYPAFQQLKAGDKVKYITIDTAKGSKAINITKVDN